jgi:L-arabinose isomerase
MSNEYISFIVGSQDLYGEDTLEKANKQATEICAFLNKDSFRYIKYQGIVKSEAEVFNTIKAANDDDNCIGVINWMHTFSPSKMWIKGIKILYKPIVQLHTQYQKNIPFDSIDMDYMNLNQSAHGDREHGHLYTRLRKYRKIISGHYQSLHVLDELNAFIRVCAGVHMSGRLNVARFGDNMRYVAVTEGDKVEAQIKFGWSVEGYAISDLSYELALITEADIDALISKYSQIYTINTDNLTSVRYQAKIELAMKRFFEKYGIDAFTDTFENLQGLDQLPGLATQHLMASGYGFGAEGDWKTAALMKVMMKIAEGQTKGTSFMEDYTYHMDDTNHFVLGSHMLEVSPSIAGDKPRIEVHNLGIGNKESPARLIFNGKKGEAILVSLIDIGTRFRMVISEIEAIEPPMDLPNLPNARVFYRLKPNFEIATKAWLMTGAAHHTIMSYDVTASQMMDLADIWEIEAIHINEKTTIDELKSTLRINDVIWRD